MTEDAKIRELAKAMKGHKTRPLPHALKAELDSVKSRTELAPEAPAPRLGDMIATLGLEPATEAVAAWDARVRGKPVIDIAHELGISIAGCRALIKQAQEAVAQDLKDALELNRELDLARLDGMLGTYYPQAITGNLDAANVTLRCLQHRAKLTGLEPQGAVVNAKQPQNVYMWIQQQLPMINKIVDALPLELAE